MRSNGTLDFNTSTTEASTSPPYERPQSSSLRRSSSEGTKPSSPPESVPQSPERSVSPDSSTTGVVYDNFLAVPRRATRSKLPSPKVRSREQLRISLTDDGLDGVLYNSPPLSPTDHRSGPDGMLVVPSLTELLESAELRTYLFAFARTVYQDESVAFWSAVTDFNSLTEPQAQLEKAREIQATFLDAGGPMEVTVEYGKRQPVVSSIESQKVHTGLFFDMQREVENLLRSNLYPPFKTAAVEHQCLDFAVIKPKRDSQGRRPSHEEKTLRVKAAVLLETLLLEPSNHCVLYSLCEVYTIHEGHDEEERDFLSGVNEILLQNRALQEFYQYVLTREVEGCHEGNTLFRERSVFSLLLSDLTARQPCVKWLRDIATSAVTFFVKRSKTIMRTQSGAATSFDINVEGDVTTAMASRNAGLILGQVESILANIRLQYARCPPSLRKIMSRLSRATAQKFPELRYAIVGSVLFLRFVNPALVSPEKFGLCKDEPSIPQRRGLILVSKILQCAASGTLMTSHSPKTEAAYEVFNRWLATQHMTMQTLFASIMSVTDEELSAVSDAPSLRGGSNESTPPIKSPVHSRRSSRELPALNVILDELPVTPAGADGVAVGGASKIAGTSVIASVSSSTSASSPVAVPATSTNNNNNNNSNNVLRRPDSLQAAAAESTKPSPRFLLRWVEIKDKLAMLTRDNDRLALNLAPRESLALRLRVLDTLVEYQGDVDDLVRTDARGAQQWQWLKESLRSLLQERLK